MIEIKFTEDGNTGSVFLFDNGTISQTVFKPSTGVVMPEFRSGTIHYDNEREKQKVNALKIRVSLHLGLAVITTSNSSALQHLSAEQVCAVREWLCHQLHMPIAA